MKLVAIMPVRNENWVLGLSLRAALKWCDAAVVLNHASTDGTADILDEIQRENPNRLTIITDRENTWKEMAHRQSLLDAARMDGATHVALVDADEILTGDLLPTIREQVRQLPLSSYVQIPMRNLWRSIAHYRSDAGIFGCRAITSVAFADTAACSWFAKNGYDHHHREPHGARCALRAYDMPGGVMHLQFASWRRLTAKHALYKMTERLRWPEKPVAEIERLYNLALDESGLQRSEVPVGWWAPYVELMEHLDVDREPWQERECQRLWKMHGHGAFYGLNLFGVPEGCHALAS
jgi:glycosyltransferase involved in cell wall biosynthesis